MPLKEKIFGHSIGSKSGYGKTSLGALKSIRCDTQGHLLVKGLVSVYSGTTDFASRGNIKFTSLVEGCHVQAREFEGDYEVIFGWAGEVPGVAILFSAPVSAADVIAAANRSAVIRDMMTIELAPGADEDGLVEYFDDTYLVLGGATIEGTGVPGGSTYSPSFDFSDSRNSQYLAVLI